MSLRLVLLETSYIAQSMQSPYHKNIMGVCMDCILQTKQRIASLKAAHQSVPSYLPSYLKWLDQSLNKMRSVAVYYKEYSTLENLQLLGEEYI